MLALDTVKMSVKSVTSIEQDPVEIAVAQMQCRIPIQQKVMMWARERRTFLLMILLQRCLHANNCLHWEPTEVYNLLLTTKCHCTGNQKCERPFFSIFFKYFKRFLAAKTQVLLHLERMKVRTRI